MYPHKWLSNSIAVLQHIPEEKRATNVLLNKSSDLPSVKALGLKWLADEDSFTFDGQFLKNDLPPTKRNFLKRMASLFDPMGFLHLSSFKLKSFCKRYGHEDLIGMMKSWIVTYLRKRELG